MQKVDAGPQGMTITGDIKPGYETILTPEALDLVATLHRAFEPRRQALLKARIERTKRLDAGERPDFLVETQSIRNADWTIAPTASQSATEEVAYGKWIDETSAREQARSDRIHGAVGVIPGPLWAVIFFVAAIIFVFMLFFADSGERAIVQAVLMGSVAGAARPEIGVYGRLGA